MIFATQIAFAALPFCLVLIAWSFWRRSVARKAAPLQSASERWLGGTGMTRNAGRRGRVPRGVFLLVGTVLVVAALARPQWGSEPEVTFDQAREVVLALDLSQSMLADDVAPNRLARSKLLIESLLGELEGERVGLIVFSGTAFLQVPLSSDYEVMREILPELQPSYLPQGGTDFEALLRSAIRSFHDAEGDGERFLIVLSDGEAHDESWRSLLPALRAKGIRVVGLGVGTAEGGLVPDGSGGFVKAADGAVVLSRLAPGTLEELASETRGVYRDASAWVDIAEVVDATVEQGFEGKYVEEIHSRLQDRFQWLLGPGIALLFLAFWRELPVNPVARSVRQSRHRSGMAGATAAVLALLLLSGGRAQAAEVAGAETAAPPVALEVTVSELIVRDRLGPTDYEQLARVTLDHLRVPEPPPETERLGVIDDALRGIDRGEALDPEAADWPALREQLVALREAPPQPEQQSTGDESGESQQSEESESESGQEQGGEAQSESGGQQADSESGESQDGSEQGSSSADQAEASSEKDGESAEQAGEQSTAGSNSEDGQREEPEARGDRGDASESEQASAREESGETSQGMAPRNEEDRSQLTEAGFGDLDDETGGEGEEGPEPELQAFGEEPSPEPAQRLVGGGTGDMENAALRQSYGGAVGRMESVRKQDAPAVLFERMQRAEEPAPVQRKANRKDW